MPSGNTIRLPSGKTLVDIATETGMKLNTIWARWARGWTEDRLLAGLQVIRSSPSDLEARFCARVEIPRDVLTGCWRWTGSKTGFGHGSMKCAGQTFVAHRLSYEILRGPIPKGLVVRHAVCGDGGCVNPNHLEVGTQSDNCIDTVRMGRNKRPLRLTAFTDTHSTK